jgi:MerR family transcriptional regulator, thiopeptide resistance regulator
MITFIGKGLLQKMPTAAETGNEMKVGDLAKRTGLSVRTLHYYDEIGLLQPRDLTASGHRVYGADELARLQRIKSLRQLGFSLDEIRACLDAPEFSAHRVIELHIKRLRDQIGEQERLVAVLETLDASFAAGTIASPDQLIRAIESMTSLEREFTPEEWNEIKERGERLGRDHVRAVEREWPGLIARMRAAMLRGDDPASADVAPLAARWRELVREFTGGSPEIERKVRAGYVNDPERMKRAGLDPALFAYANRAIRALAGSRPD